LVPTLLSSNQFPAGVFGGVLRPHHSAQKNIIWIHLLLLLRLPNKHSRFHSDAVSAADCCSFRNNYLDFSQAAAKLRSLGCDTKHRQFLTNDRRMCDVPTRVFVYILPVSSGMKVARPDVDAWPPVCLKTTKGDPSHAKEKSS